MPITKNNAPTTEVAQGAKGISQAFDSAPPVPAYQAKAQAKRLATAMARTALWGGTLAQIEDDRGRSQFVITRWALTRAFEDLAEVDAWLTQVTGETGWAQ